MGIDIIADTCMDMCVGTCVDTCVHTGVDMYTVLTNTTAIDLDAY